MATLAWSTATLLKARTAVADPKNANWPQCEGTWFVGIDVLPDDAQGRIWAPLQGAAVDFIRHHIGPIPPLHAGQLSVVYPGYPKPHAGETETAFRYCKTCAMRRIRMVSCLLGWSGGAWPGNRICSL